MPLTATLTVYLPYTSLAPHLRESAHLPCRIWRENPAAVDTCFAPDLQCGFERAYPELRQNRTMLTQVSLRLASRYAFTGSSS